MSPMKWLNYILFIENLLGIHRNYCNQSNIKKCLISFQIFTQNILDATAVIAQMKLLFRGQAYGQMNLIPAFYYASAYVNSLFPIVISICYSHCFMSYYRSVKRISKYFIDDERFLNFHKKVFWFSIFLILLSLSFIAYRFVSNKTQMFQLDLFSLMITFPLKTANRLNMVFQNLTVFIAIIMVVNSLKSLTSLILVVQRTVGNCYIGFGEQCDITKEQIQTWVELYRDIANCCKKITICFGRQVSFTLAISTSKFILLTYQICYKVVLEYRDINEFKNMVIVQCYNLSLILMLTIPGQMAHNEGVKIHRVLARLYSTIIKDFQEAEAKLIKDFIRLIKENPIEIKLFCNIPFGLCILPVILTFAVNNVIVMLQFNHII